MMRLGIHCIGLASALLASSAFAELPHINYETHPQRALDISADGQWLAAAHTADARVQLFRLGAYGPVPAGHVKVGLEPVAVRFRANNELWVANHLSDSISIIDPASRRLLRTLQTGDEPFDIAFAGDRAFVSCSQINEVWVFDPADLAAPHQVLSIAAEDPRGLAVSPDGHTVAVAIFESGNASTALGGGLDGDMILAVPNVVSDPRGPYGGINPPPNNGAVFDPPRNAAATPPRVGLIVRQDAEGRWRDDNAADWTRLVSGELASASGRRPGWSLPDRDLALIDVDSLAVSYVSGLMNIGMALAAHPTTGRFTLVGTDARNQIRFEPKLNGRFLEVRLAATAADGSPTLTACRLHVGPVGGQRAQPIAGRSARHRLACRWPTRLGQRHGLEQCAADHRRRKP
jgi:YVTN family beta-propeller protein